MADAKKISDPPLNLRRAGAKLAQKVIEAYADLDGLTREECAKLLPHEPAHYCGVIVDTLGKGAEGEVTVEERVYLEKVGFAKEFVDGITGSDGKKALRERAKWLGDHCVKEFWRWDVGPDERKRMIDEIGAMRHEAASAMPRLIEALKDGERQVRWAAGRALAEIGASAVPVLIEALKERDMDMRTAAALFLGEIGPPAASAIPSLIEALKGDSRAVRTTAAYALSKICADAVPLLAGYLDDDDGNIRSGCASALGLIGKPAHHALPFLEQMRDNDPDATCRQAVGEAVEKILKDVK